MKVLFEVRRFNGQDVIIIDNSLFDWGLDKESLNEIKKIKDKQQLEKINENIKKYFLDCLESFIGKRLSIKEVIDSLKSGYIEL
jgi:hypothetical protein